MKTTKWEDLKKKMLSPGKIAEIEERARQASLELDLRALRELAGKTQAQVAKLMKVAQGEISRVERREDHRLSTLRTYVEALGGELEVVARFEDKTIRLHGV